MLVLTVFLWTGVYVTPCQKGSLLESNYSLDVSGYFCTEPTRVNYPGDVDDNIYVYDESTDEVTDPTVQPCNCFGQPLVWRTEIVPYLCEQADTCPYTGFLDLVNANSPIPWDPVGKTVANTPCRYIEAGITWDVAPNGIPDPDIPTIPPGDYVNIYKSGSQINEFSEYPDADPVPCGVTARNVYQAVREPVAPYLPRHASMPISEYCAVNETKTATIFKNTVNRYANLLQQNLQCTIGYKNAFLMMAGLTSTGSTIQDQMLQDNPELNFLLPDIDVLTTEYNNKIFACNAFDLAQAVVAAVEQMQTYLKSITIPLNSMFYKNNQNLYIMDNEPWGVTHNQFVAQNDAGHPCFGAFPLPEPNFMFEFNMELDDDILTTSSIIVPIQWIKPIGGGFSANVAGWPTTPNLDYMTGLLYTFWPMQYGAVTFNQQMVRGSTNVNCSFAGTMPANDANSITLNGALQSWVTLGFCPQLSGSCEGFKSGADITTSGQLRSLLIGSPSGQIINYGTICNPGSVIAMLYPECWCAHISCLPSWFPVDYMAFNSSYFNSGAILNGTKYNINTYTGRVAFSQQLSALATYFISIGVQLAQSTNGDSTGYNSMDIFNQFLSYIDSYVSIEPSVNKVTQMDLLPIIDPTAFSTDTSTTSALVYGTFGMNVWNVVPDITAEGASNPFAVNGTYLNLLACLDYPYANPTNGAPFFAPPNEMSYYHPTHVTSAYTTFFAQPLLSGTFNLNGVITNGFLQVIIQYMTARTYTAYESGLSSSMSTLETILNTPTTNCVVDSMTGKYQSQDWAKTYFHTTHASVYNSFVVPFARRNISGNCYNYSTGVTDTGTYCFFQMYMDPIIVPSIQTWGGSIINIPYSGCKISSQNQVLTCYCQATSVACNMPISLPLFVEQSLLFWQNTSKDIDFNYTIDSNNNYISATTDGAFDNIHCVEQGYELPSFINPFYQPSEDGPPSLTATALDTWCQGFNQTNCSIHSQWCIYNGTQCILRMYQYGLLTEIIGDTNVYTRPDPLCQQWDFLLDPIEACQNANAFTGCVLVHTPKYSGNASEAVNDDTVDVLDNGGSVRIPNSYQRLTFGDSYPTQFYQATVSGLIVRTHFIGGEPVNVIRGACRYVSTTPTIEYLNIENIGAGLLNFTTYITNPNTSVYALNPLIYQNLLHIPIPPTDVLIPMVEATDGDPVPDLGRIRIRCDFEFNVTLDRRSMHALNQDLMFVTNFKPYNNSVPLAMYATDIQCVPLNLKTNITLNINDGSTSAIQPLVNGGNLYQTIPVDCNALIYDTNNLDADVTLNTIQLYTLYCTSQASNYAGIYYETFQMYNQLPATLADHWYLNIGTNLHLDMSWFYALAPTDPVISYYFDAVSNVQNNYVNNSLEILPPTLQGKRCSTASGICGIMVDSVFKIPCGIIANIQLGRCVKPGMQIQFPLFDPMYPLAAGQVAPFIQNAFKWSAGIPAYTSDGVQTAALQAAIQQAKNYTWDEQLTMVNYFDPYFNAPVYCTNDPLSLTERMDQINNKKAQIHFAGSSFDAFTLNDICPFLYDSSRPRECYIFIGTNYLGSLENVLSITRCNNQPCDWSSVRFYIVPYSSAIFQYMMFHVAAGDTTITNRFDSAESAILNISNLYEYGPNAEILAGPRIRLLDSWTPPNTPGVPNATINRIYADGICNRAIGLSLEVIQFYYAVLQNHAVGDGTYQFVSIQSTGNISSVINVPESQLIQPWIPMNIPIVYDSITIAPAIGTELIAAAPLNQSVNLQSCVRFVITANAFTVVNLTVYQTGPCANLSPLNTVPFYFNPPSATYTLLENIAIYGSTVGVAFIGDNTILDCTGTILNNINLQTSYKQPYTVISTKTVGTYYVSNPVDNPPQEDTSFVTPVQYDQNIMVTEAGVFMSGQQLYATNTTGTITLQVTNFPLLYDYTTHYLYTTQYYEKFYVYLNTTTFMFWLSVDRANKFFVNALNSLLYIYDSPYLCMTSRYYTGGLTYEPCIASYIGAQTQAPCPNPYSLTQWPNITLTLSPTQPGYCWTTPNGNNTHIILEYFLPHYNPVTQTPYNLTQYNYSLSSDGGYLPCMPCWWISHNFAVSNRTQRFNGAVYTACHNATGIKRVACNGYSNAGLMGVFPATCSSSAASVLADGILYGYGAIISCQNGEWVVLTSGYGYMNQEILHITGTFQAITNNILIHPINVEPEIISHNVLITDLSTIVNKTFGARVEYNLYNTPISVTPLNYTALIILLVIFFVLFLFIVFMHKYTPRR